MNPTTKQPIPSLTLGEPQGVTLDPTLTNGAQLWAESLAKKNQGLKHSSGKDIDPDAGENIFFYGTQSSTPPTPEFLAKAAIASFAGEEANYDYTTGAKNQGKKEEDQIGHFTQLVWASTTNFSCGAAGATTADKGGFYNYYVVCQYYPAGNVEGQYTSNVFPKSP